MSGSLQLTPNQGSKNGFLQLPPMPNAGRLSITLEYFFTSASGADGVGITYRPCGTVAPTTCDSAPGSGRWEYVDWQEGDLSWGLSEYLGKSRLAHDHILSQVAWEMPISHLYCLDISTPNMSPY